MPTLTVLIQNGAVCQCLREKKMFYEGDSQPLPGAMDIIPAAEKAAQMPSGPFWCALTQKITGPDDQFAGVKSCRAGRSCCQLT